MSLFHRVIDALIGLFMLVNSCLKRRERDHRNKGTTHFATQVYLDAECGYSSFGVDHKNLTLKLPPPALIHDGTLGRCSLVPLPCSPTSLGLPNGASTPVSPDTSCFTIDQDYICMAGADLAYLNILLSAFILEKDSQALHDHTRRRKRRRKRTPPSSLGRSSRPKNPSPLRQEATHYFLSVTRRCSSPPPDLNLQADADTPTSTPSSSCSTATTAQICDADNTSSDEDFATILPSLSSGSSVFRFDASGNFADMNALTFASH
ncbi:hypothetical protein CONPUDRAFT_157021 [Coniophora puteana RWD-64-598 SS2]|uniref:Uncharacterized protein n=1 Tax=Coniophora puteana (strain RWD-64-598) TaxID=741705 RepID=A0A5M3MF29_CONPW|nr:uncharacterized protein CONPUDRAFT_157021 [Coniophora puteana RWD-64-598 SS2]EIW77838.1 hypothetical protein CONPUDRAFT_157021 [Coniophora puteana RWD-64-598 SS2]